MITCPENVNATPLEAIKWLEEMRDKWTAIRLKAQADVKEIPIAQRPGCEALQRYEHCINQEDRYLGLLTTISSTQESIVLEKVQDEIKEMVEKAKQSGKSLDDFTIKYRSYNLTKLHFKETTMDEVLEAIDTDTNPTRMQGLEQALRAYCPYDPLDSLPCPQCGRDEPTLEI